MAISLSDINHIASELNIIEKKTVQYLSISKKKKNSTLHDLNSF